MTCQSVKHLLVDHDKIGTVLSAFENYLTQFEESGEPSRNELRGLMDCLTEGLLLKHEEKEESVLLPELSRHGLSWSDSALKHVRQEHQQGRYLIRSLRQAAYQKATWGTDDRRHFQAIGKEWIEFNRHHMKAEEVSLFPLVEKYFSPEEDEAVAHRMEEIERDFDEMPDAECLRDAREAFVEKYANS